MKSHFSYDEKKSLLTLSIDGKVRAVTKFKNIDEAISQTLRLVTDLERIKKKYLGKKEVKNK